MAERYARERRFGLEVYPADWRLGPKAGPLRNQKMVDVADFAVAFFDGGPGTRSLITLAKQKGIPVRVYSLMPD